MDRPIANGPLPGNPWGELASHARGRRGTQLGHYCGFPLLVKFIFPCDMLSIQVHPDDAYAAKHEQAAGGRGKNRDVAHPLRATWCGIADRIEARGSRKKCFGRASPKGKLRPLPTPPGAPRRDLFLPAGHATRHRARMVLCEVQEYSDLTYRVYDFWPCRRFRQTARFAYREGAGSDKFCGNACGKVPPLALHSPMPKNNCWRRAILRDGALGTATKQTLIESDSERFQLLVILGRPRQVLRCGQSARLPHRRGVVSSGFPAGAFFATRERDRAFARHCAGYCGAAPATAENGLSRKRPLPASWLSNVAWSNKNEYPTPSSSPGDAHALLAAQPYTRAKAVAQHCG